MKEKANWVTIFLHFIFGAGFGFVLSFFVLFWFLFLGLVSSAIIWMMIGGVTLVFAVLSLWRGDSFWRDLSENPLYQLLKFW